MRRAPTPPFEVEIDHLGTSGIGVGRAPDGRPAHVRFAPPGSRVLVIPQGRKKGVWQGRRIAMIRPPVAHEVPPCAQFGVCGGCALQELAPAAQLAAKARMAIDAIASERPLIGVDIHAPRAASAPYGYRNRVELAFGGVRYVSEADRAAGAELDGRWLGFHAPGRFDRVVDARRCWLAGPGTNAVIAAVRAVALDPSSPAPWDPVAHVGFWRHLAVRETDTGELLVALHTAPGAADAADWAARVAEAVAHADLASRRLAGFLWLENDGVADVARGRVMRTLGASTVEERLGDVRFELSATAFFQTSTGGATVLYDTVGEALGDTGGTLLDLYCGVGAIGLYHARRFARVVGIEENAAAITDAHRNVSLNGIAHADFRVGRVEDALAVLEETAGPRAIVVDPPRAGLHPRAAAGLAAAAADVLVYVACHPASLGRDARVLEAGGFALTDVWTVDLFPQTGHVEAVGRFVRAPAHPR